MSPQIKFKVGSVRWKVLTFNSQPSTLNFHKGFTLIELMIVVAILGILATIAFAILKPAFLFGQGKDAKRVSDLKQIQTALEQYYIDNKVYPPNDATVGSWNGSLHPVGGCSSYPQIYNAVSSYLKSIPDDPDSSRHYYYVSVDSQNYRLQVRLDGTGNITPIDYNNCAGSYTVNYELTNP